MFVREGKQKSRVRGVRVMGESCDGMSAVRLAAL